MSFYVTLPSDSSRNYFPENKISHFITRLPAPVELKGEWEVGLVEFIYPHTWYNVNQNNNLFGFDLNDQKSPFGRRIPPGFYESVDDILKAMSIEEIKNKISFTYDPHTKKVCINVKDKTKLILHEGIAQMLGFEPGEIASPDINIEQTIFSTYVADPCAHYRVLLVYSDIVEPQIIGDVLAPLLRIVNVRGKDGEMICETFDRPHYLPVSRKSFDSLEIVIRNHLGELTPFERGRSYVKLHFRQKYLS